MALGCSLVYARRQELRASEQWLPGFKLTCMPCIPLSLFQRLMDRLGTQYWKHHENIEYLYLIFYINILIFYIHIIHSLSLSIYIYMYIYIYIICPSTSSFQTWNGQIPLNQPGSAAALALAPGSSSHGATRQPAGGAQAEEDVVI